MNCWHVKLIKIAGARNFEIFTPEIWLGLIKAKTDAAAVAAGYRRQGQVASRESKTKAEEKYIVLSESGLSVVVLGKYCLSKNFTLVLQSHPGFLNYGHSSD